MKCTYINAPAFDIQICEHFYSLLLPPHMPMQTLDLFLKSLELFHLYY